VLNTLLTIALKNISLEIMLEQFVHEITSLPWLAFESRGAIFLAEENQSVLKMVAQHGLDESLRSMCASVPFGVCLCGRAAATGELQFADCLDERHDYQYADISPHGHYCVPIISRESDVMGVITLYLSEGHSRDQREEDFIGAVASTLAGIVELKQAYQQLEERTNELELKQHEIEEVNAALRVLLKKRDEDKLEFEEKLLLNIRTLAMPNLKNLKDCGLNQMLSRVISGY
jgi:GAF domain-containing protein